MGRAVAATLSIALFGCFFAAVASANTYTVNNTGDEAEEVPCARPGTPCSLREAMLAANIHEGTDRIVFDIEGGGKPPFAIPISQGTLPVVADPVDIDGTTQPGYEGEPVIFIENALEQVDPTAFEFGAGSDGSSLEGLAIGNFGIGIYVYEAVGVRFCANQIGTEVGGLVPAPNTLAGIEVDENADGTLIGSGCPGNAGNLISGNSLVGVLDYGHGARISANRIGVDSEGAPLPNGTGPEPGLGVEIAGSQAQSTVGPGNEIAYNEGPGVAVAEGAGPVAIRANAIFENEGLGILYPSGASPPAPVLGSAQGEALQTVVGGIVHGDPNATYELEFFANGACDPSGFGEGESYLGAGTAVADGSGAASFSVSGLASVAGLGGVVTATATNPADGSTSEFSACRTVTPVTTSTVPGGGASQTSGPVPENGQTVIGQIVSGKILVKLPGGKHFHLLGEGEQIPVGAIVDARAGKVSITSADAHGQTQTAVFYAGIFQVSQAVGSSLVVLKLRGGDFRSCATAGSSATASKRAGRRLWGSGKGNFRSVGAHGSATVRGTKWLTEDRCDATFFKVVTGFLDIRDFQLQRRLRLSAGGTYLTGG